MPGMRLFWASPGQGCDNRARCAKTRRWTGRWGQKDEPNVQASLMGSMIADLTTALDDVVDLLRTDTAAPRTVADRVFDAFGKGGAGQLAAWIVLSGDVGQLDPVRKAVRELVDALVARSQLEAAPERVRAVVMMMAVCAFGDAVIGPHLRAMLDQGDDAMRDLVAHILPLFLVPSGLVPPPGSD